MQTAAAAQADPQEEILAAVDLGSNSFHMIIARVQDGALRVEDRLREQVQLGAGLDAARNLTPEAELRAIACLERFGERVHGLPPGQVRAVGTNTLRRMRSSAAFLRTASRALGHPIEVIAGQEEARLIYLGVAHSQADDAGRRLVMDIGGGSTEFIIGERFEPRYRESLYMGCVSMSMRFFPEGAVTEQTMLRAEIAARLELEAIEQAYREVGWQDCVGSSGTIKSIRAVIEANGWGENGITPKALQKLRKAVIKVGSTKSLDLPGLVRERAAVFPGGLAILTAAFESLGIERMTVSDGALREGLLYDLLGRIGHEDVRERTIQAMARRYHVSMPFAERVESTASACLGQVRESWGLTEERHHSFLRWAALLHEVGLAISHHGYHKHGAYLVRHADMPGFSREDQEVLGTMIRGHRRKFPKSDLEECPEAIAPVMGRLAILLRLAVLLNHGRSPEPLPEFRLHPGQDALAIEFPDGWLAQHPLTAANLAQEAAYLEAVKFSLSYR